MIKETEREYFELDVASSFESVIEPCIKYNVRGSILDTDNIESFLYMINSSKNSKKNILYGIYLDNKLFIKDKVSLKEVFQIEESTRKVIEVALTIDEDPNASEKFIIDPQSKIYRLYLNGKMDVVLFCNLIYFKREKIKIRKQ